MDEIQSLMHGFAVALTPNNLVLMFIGIILGVIIGVLPGWAARTASPSCCRSRSPWRRRPAADLGDHPALLHLLGRALRRRHHLDPVQHPGRAVVGGHDLRRLPAGAAGPRRRSADRGIHLVVRRRAGRGDHDHLPVAARRELRAGVRPAGVLRRLPAHLLRLHRHEQGAAVQDAGGDDARFRAGCGGHRHR